MANYFKNIYFIGIGGIGMSALARWFNAKGYFVAGYDRTPTALTDSLIKEGINIHFEDDINLIPETIKNSSIEENLIVYTPAVPNEHTELNYFLQKGHPIHKRAEVLGWISKDYFTVAVAGTHGKTTTSSMIAHILHQAGKPCIAFLGGIVQNYDSNLILDKGIDKEIVMVVEADEYDKSFLHLQPNIAVVTSMDADHLDIYGEKAHVIASFKEFIKKIQVKGKLFTKKDLDLSRSDIPNTVSWQNYAVNTVADCWARDAKIENENFVFDYVSEEAVFFNVQLQTKGFHNIENAVVAIAVTNSLGIAEADIKAALASYQGVKRRFEYIIRTEKMVYIDDYAHHPTEIEAFLTSLKALYPNKKVTAVFQPHLYSRTRDFVDEFAESLSLADEVLLLDIYPARELPIAGISSQLILDKITTKKKALLSKEMLLEVLEKNKIEVLATMGAGDIDRLIPQIKVLLEKK